MIETKKTPKIVEIKSAPGFLELAGQDYLSSLLDLAKECHRQPKPKFDCVILHQIGRGDDLNLRFFKELSEELLADELTERILKFRKLLLLVRKSPIPWIYVGESHCFGSHFELALSCQQRLWFSLNAKVGFPEVTQGVFPPGGSLERSYLQRVKVKDFWEKDAIISVSTARDQAYIDFLAEAQNGIELAKEWISHLPAAQNRSPQDKASLEKKAVSQSSSKSRQDILVGLESSWYREQIIKSNDASAWEYYWRLVKEKNRFGEKHEFDELVAYIAARKLLSSSFINWYRYRLTKNAMSFPSPRVGKNTLPIRINLESALIPPNQPLVNLLTNEYSIVLVAPDSKGLTAAVELIYGRMERFLSGNELRKAWEKQVSWYVGNCQDKKGMVLSWLIDDRLMVDFEHHRYEFLRFDGNHRSAPLGWGEWYPQAESNYEVDEVIAVLGCLLKGVVFTNDVGIKTLPLTVLVRSLFFHELMRVARFMDSDLTATVQALAKYDWQFSGREASWDRFLRSRAGFLTKLGGTLPVPKELGLEGLDFNSDTWKQARAIVHSEAKKTPTWNPLAISNHMAIYSGFLAKAMLKNGFVKNDFGADLLVESALGFPKKLGTPLSFLAARGLRRVRNYKEKYWPRISLQPESTKQDEV